MHPADVHRDVVTEFGEEHRQRPVEVEAVSAPAGGGDPPHGGVALERPRFGEVDPGRLVGHPLDMTPVDAVQCIGTRWLPVEPEPGEIGVGVRFHVPDGTPPLGWLNMSKSSQFDQTKSAWIV